MTLSDFILTNVDAILAEWEQFAQSLPAAATMDRKALRDDAQRMLIVIAKDMATPQSDDAQEAKSKGRGLRNWEGRETAAETHAGARLLAGFDFPQVVSEYRALRASVIRLWIRSASAGQSEAIYELTRFNEAVDQALAESTVRYTRDIDRSRDLFLAALGHDLRSPLAAILLSANSLLLSDSLPNAHTTTVTRILTSGARIQDLVSQLLDVARVRLGGLLRVALKPLDLAPICEQGVAEARTLHPGRTIKLRLAGDLNGKWDAARISQLLSNLLQNAIQRGAKNRPVTLSADGEEGHVTLRVHNEGKSIPESTLARIFEPLVWTEESKEEHSSSSGLGLGLYIACAIAEAHGGTIGVDSSEKSGTTFTVRLPRPKT